MYSLLFGGSPYQGIFTTVEIFRELVKRAGYRSYTVKKEAAEFGSTCSSVIIGFGTEEYLPPSGPLDGIIALNGETIYLNKSRLKSNGFILGEAGWTQLYTRSLDIDIGRVASNIGSRDVEGSVAVGVLLKLFGMDLRFVLEVMTSAYIRQFVDINLKAVTAGYEAAGKIVLADIRRLASDEIMGLGA